MFRPTPKSDYYDAALINLRLGDCRVSLIVVGIYDILSRKEAIIYVATIENWVDYVMGPFIISTM